MAYTSEIEKLEKRWLENPKGRNFAPLADAYRKAGELDRAIELCQSGLALHPDYVSAHIVYARCLIDQKNDAGAEEVFKKILELDRENIIALKVLAEIADRRKRPDEAVVWLTRLLAADPMNGDAAEALARAKGKAAALVVKTTVPVAEPVARLLAPEPGIVSLEPAPLTEAPTTAMGKPDFEIEHTSVEQVPPLSAPPRRSGTGAAPAGVGELETFDGSIDVDAAAHSAAKAEGLEVQEDVELKPQRIEVEGLARTQYEGSRIFKLDVPPPPEPAPAAFSPPPPVAAEDEELPEIDLPLIMPEDLEPVAEAAEPPAPPPPTPARSRGRPAPVVDDDGAADTAALSRAEPVLTETMAELYRNQGHPEDALRVYQALLAQRPGDARLQAKIDALTGDKKRGAASGLSVGAYLKNILHGAPLPGSRATAPRGAPASSLEGAFAGVTPEPEGEADLAEPPGAPTQPTDEALSLDAVFGDEGVRSSVPSAPPSAPSGGGGGFSFDEFFNAPSAGAAAGAEGGGGAGGARPTGAPEPGRSSGRHARPPVDDEGDLDQFQSWLKGLKS